MCEWWMSEWIVEQSNNHDEDAEVSVEYETWIPKWLGQEKFYWPVRHKLMICRITVYYV